MPTREQIPVIDIFAGPGGLGEGFGRYHARGSKSSFRVALSIEKDAFAYRTLLLRAFYRQFRPDDVPPDFYDYVRGDSSAELADLLQAYPEGRAALEEVHRLELGRRTYAETDQLIRKALGPKRGRGPWVLIGGPPCQAYSLAGRSRMRPKLGAAFDDDARHTLYREYLRLIREHRPTVFVMENVKGLLSSEHKSRLIIDRILRDLGQPGPGLRYELFPLSDTGSGEALFDAVAEPDGFVVGSEHFGVPQARHRVIILGVLAKDYRAVGRRPGHLCSQEDVVPAATVLDDLPRLRSALSRQDSFDGWAQTIRSVRQAAWLELARSNGLYDVGEQIDQMLDRLSRPRADLGRRFIASRTVGNPSRVQPAALRAWLVDERLRGVLNHQARGHMPSDLHRYFFAACYARVRRASPRLQDFPEALWPRHRNVKRALAQGLFNDRFRVQLRHTPSSTVTSHISKDGHYFIHPDPVQCRSLTVREAARLHQPTDLHSQRIAA